MSTNSIKLMDDPIDKSWEVAQLVKMTNKKGVLKNSPVVHYCVFCPENAKGYQYLTRHWFDHHKNCKEVKEILEISQKKIKLKTLPPKEKERQILRAKRVNLLKHKGDYR